MPQTVMTIDRIRSTRRLSDNAMVYREIFQLIREDWQDWPYYAQEDEQGYMAHPEMIRASGDVYRWKPGTPIVDEIQTCTTNQPGCESK
jgi:hypothetical protein